MSVLEAHINYVYDKEVASRISEKYNMPLMEALAAYVQSQTYAMFCDPEFEMLSIPPDGIFDMWENERVTGNPRNSIYIGREDRV